MITKMWKLETILYITLMDLFWSDDYEFVISKKEDMYLTKTIRLEKDELRHER